MTATRTSVVPDLLGALYDQVKAALEVDDEFDEVEVCYGPGNAKGGDSLQVGVSMPDSEYDQQAASTAETPGPYSLNRPRDEIGMVWLTATAWKGNSDDAGNRAAVERVYAIAGQVAMLLRFTGQSDSSLGIPGMQWVRYGGAAQLWTGQDANGPAARLTFSVNFFARI